MGNIRACNDDYLLRCINNFQIRRIIAPPRELYLVAKPTRFGKGERS
jgi:hypothetical protein